MFDVRRGYLAPLAILSTFALSSAGCGQKSGNKEAKTSSDSIDTFIVDARIVEGKTLVTYRSNIKDARFKCMIQPKAAPQAGATWQDCAKEGLSVDVMPGVDYVVRVKAVSPSGAEDGEPAERLLAASGNGSQGFGEGEGDDAAQGPVSLEAVIINQADIKDPFDKSTLRLAFGTRGATVDTDDLTFECKESPATAYTACSGKDFHVVQNLADNSNYSLSVRAVHRPTKSISKAAKVSFSVKLNALLVQGADQMETAKTGRIQLNIGKGNERLTCTLDGKPTQNCSSQMMVDLDRMPAGSHQYVFTTDAGLSSTINFCAQSCSSAGAGLGQSGNGSYGSGQPVTHQIGSFYTFTVDPGLHVTQYATTKTYNNSLAFYRITNDPFYVGVDICNLQDTFVNSVGRLVKQVSPAGVDYDYCSRTPSREYYKIMTDGRSANNHVEVATDANIAEQSPFDQERILINVFDTDYEFMIERSRFEALCSINMNMRGRITKSPFVPVMNQGFWGNGVFSEIFACNGKLPTTGGGLPTVDQGGWWVGAFYISTNDALPRIECFQNDYRSALAGPGAAGNYGNINPQFCGSYKNPGMIEVVYMTKRPFQTDYDFMQAMQNRIRGNLRELMPRLQTPGVP